MALFTQSERRFLSAAAELAYCNPFLPERVEWEKQALGSEYRADHRVWSSAVDNPLAKPANIIRLENRLETMLRDKPDQLARARHVSGEDLRIYESSIRMLLYQRYHDRLVAVRTKAPCYKQFLADVHRFFDVKGQNFGTLLQPAHVFAVFHQIQRAFHAIFDHIIGSSMPAARLRAAVWQSAFTHDLQLYGRALFRRMGEFPTLITGPSGTGKELVARAIAMSRYLPFDSVRMEFVDPAEESFFPVNLAALSPALIESELFGHRRGSFTGAVADRKGYLEACPEPGSVFLDEIGELDLSIQVKLLRVIETRRFSVVGDTKLREFGGKLIAATNRDLPVEIELGRFREDLYYRLCADLIRTPSLKEQLDDSPGILRDLILHMLRRAVNEEAERYLPQVEKWLKANIPDGYTWPGNYRELEQCIRNVIIRRSYVPMQPSSRTKLGVDPELAALHAGEWTADEVLDWYVQRVYQKHGTYEEAARRLGLDRRTVKARAERYLRAKGANSCVPIPLR